MRLTESKDIANQMTDRNSVFVKFDGINFRNETSYGNPMNFTDQITVMKEWVFTLRTKYFGKGAKIILDKIYRKYTSLYLEKVVGKPKYYNWQTHIESASVVDNVLEMRFVFSGLVAFRNDEEAVSFAVKMSETRMKFGIVEGNGWMEIIAELCG